MQAIARIADILDKISACESGMSLVDLTQACNISKTALHRMTHSMCDEGLLLKDDSGRFYLGPRILYWMGRYQNSFVLVKISRPIIEEIHRVTSETVHLFQYKDGEAFYIDKIESTFPLSLRSRVGTSQPLYCTGGGKAILGSLSEYKLNLYLEQHILEKRTANTITNPEILKRALAQERERGFFQDIEENDVGIRCIAVSILNEKEEPIGAVSITVPVIRVPNEAKIEEWGNILRKKVDEIEARLWGRGKNG